ncbi:MAG: AraC family transcriptional regulator [Sandaracinaceae bacterium]
MPSSPTAGRLPSATADRLTETLHHLRLSGTLYCTAELTAPWGIAIPAFDDVMMFVMVTTGELWLEVPGEDARRIGPGSLALLPRGNAHALRSDRTADLTPLHDVPVVPVSEQYETASLGGGGPCTRVTYGIHRFDHAAARRLVELLPAVLQLDAWEGGEGVEWIASTLRLVAREAQAPRPGGEIVVTRLADVLVVQMIRTWLATDQARQGWLGALRDPRLGRALAAVHRDPAAPWTLPRLAREAGMSRSAFAARFAETVGEPPMAYVTDWRMRLARSLLRDGDTSVGEIAARVGYRSDAAFGRAFKRAFGASPGRVRRAERTRP